MHSRAGDARVKNETSRILAYAIDGVLIVIYQPGVGSSLDALKDKQSGLAAFNKTITSMIGGIFGDLAAPLVQVFAFIHHFAPTVFQGLASVFEQSEFTDANHRLTGTDNWRVHHVLRAMHENHLRPTGDLVQGKSVRANNEAIDYAHARYVCLFLQDQQLLEPFYRKLRSRAETDPTGWQTLQEVVARENATDLDADFHRWIVKYHKTQRQRTVRKDGHTLSMKPFEPPPKTIAADVAK